MFSISSLAAFISPGRYRRTRLACRKFALSRRSLLAYVLAHEIARVRAGSTVHSEFGLMKAQCGEAEYVDMENRPFPFTPLDMASIGARLNVGRCRGKADEAPEAKGQSQQTLVRIPERSENPK
jgi:hypothetical protein